MLAGGASAGRVGRAITCYQRHIGDVFEALDLEYEKENRARVDRALRDLLETPADAHCPEVWAAIKALSPERRADLPALVAEVLQNE